MCTASNAVHILQSLASAFFCFEFSGEPCFCRGVCAKSLQATLQAKLSQEMATGFGSVVAMDGDTAVVGASYQGELIGELDERYYGAAYVYVRSGNNWVLQQELQLETPIPYSYFGSALAISGNTIVVGAPYERSGEVNNVGAVYVFERSDDGTWTETARLEQQVPTLYAGFGKSVAIDGDTLMVAASGDVIDGLSYAGSVTIYTRVQGVWRETQTLTSTTPASQNYFGSSVEISGMNAVVLSTSRAYIYDLSNNSQEPTQILSMPGPISVDIDGQTIVVGAREEIITEDSDAGAAYIYELSNGQWTQTQKIRAKESAAGSFLILRQSFGYSVSISGDSIVVGAPFTQDGNNPNVLGAAYLFSRDGVVWTQEDKLQTTTEVINEYGVEYGYSVAISNNAFIVGEYGLRGKGPGVGNAYIYRIDPSRPTGLVPVPVNHPAALLLMAMLLIAWSLYTLHRRKLPH